MRGAGVSERIVELDKRRVWHPYTPMKDYRERVEPLVIARAEGSRLYDVDGRCYLDGNASWWTSTLGHGHPRLVEVLRRQAETLCHSALAGIAHEPASELAEAVCAVAPAGLEHVFFSDDGSTAVEVAMKLCLQYWAQNGRPGRQRFLALDEAFHGDTLGVTALGGVEVFRRPFAGVLLDCIHVPPPREPETAARAFEALEQALRENADSLAGVVLEPVVQGAAGMRIYDASYLRHARELCDRYDVFLVFDEVFTGYGRTGPMWAGEHAGFCGNPLGAAIAREVLRVFEEEEILERAKPKAERIARAFEAMREVPGVASTRALGMVGALDLAGDAGYLAQAGWRVYDAARQRGAYLRPMGNVVYITPSVNIPDEDLDALLLAVRESVAAVAES